MPTLDGGSVKVRIPAGTRSGRTLRVKGKGVAKPRKTGDLLVTVEVAVPQKLTDDERKAVEALAAAADGRSPRSAPRDRGRMTLMRCDGREPARAVYVISVAAELAGVHPQTLRIYERKGLVDPARTTGGSRRYSDDDIEQLRASRS